MCSSKRWRHSCLEKKVFALHLSGRWFHFLTETQLLQCIQLWLQPGGILQYLLTSSLPVRGTVFSACLYGFSPLWTSPACVATVSSPVYAGCYSWQLLPVVPAAVLSRTGRTWASPLASREGTVKTNKPTKPIKIKANKQNTKSAKL